MDREKIELMKERFQISSYFDPKDIQTNGTGYKACCPFHKETIPSFFISNKNVWFCFGCNEGGDVFTFLMKKNNSTFSDIYDDFLEKLNLAEDKKQKKPAKKRNETYSKLLNASNIFFRKSLLKNQQAITYLKEKRGLSEENISLFELGYVNGVLNFIEEEELSKSLAEELFLIRSSETGYYDFLKNRITIPLFSKDEIIGFAHRSIDSDADFKYLHPTNNVMFKKNSFLYGLNWSAEHIKEKDAVIITEGYFDFISLYSHGVQNSVAVLGTNLFSDQVKTLGKLTENFYFCLDGDAAGRKSIIKNLKEVIKTGMKTFIIELPDGSDPDSFIREKGNEEFTKLYKNAIPILDYLKKQKEEELIGLLEELKGIIPKIPSSVRKQFWYNNIMESLKIDLTKDVKKEVFTRSKKEELSYNDMVFLKLYINAEDNDIKDILNKERFYETERAALLFLKLKNTQYQIEFSDDEKEIINNVKLQKQTTIDDVKKALQLIEEEKRLK